MSLTSFFSGAFQRLHSSLLSSETQARQDDDPGEGDPGEGDPGEDDPGEDDPGEDDPGGQGPGEEGLDQGSPDDEDPLSGLSSAEPLLSTAASNLWDTFGSTQGGWMAGSRPMDPFTNQALMDGRSDLFVGGNVDPFTNSAFDAANMNAYTGDADVEPFTGSGYTPVSSPPLAI